MEEVKRKPRVLDIDDGGSFQRLVEKTRFLVESKGGTAAEAINLLTFKIMVAFMKRTRENSIARKSGVVERSSSKKHNSSGCICLDKGKKLKGVLKKSKMKTKKTTMTSNLLNKKSRNGIINFEKVGLEPPPGIPRNLERKIEEKGGRDIKLVVMKQLFSTDLNKHHGRLSIPASQIRTKHDDYFLSGKEEMDVMVIEPCGEESRMVFVKWLVGSSDYYVLRTDWNAVVQRNHDEAKLFKVNDVIQVWSFRVGTQLWFAIHKVWDAPSTSSSS